MSNPNIQLDEYKDYLLMQERWKSEISELLTGVCPSAEIRRNHKTAPDLYAIYDKDNENRGFGVTHTFLFKSFLQENDEKYTNIDELYTAWNKFMMGLIISLF